ncbi:MAG: DUF6364 family protein [Bacteroidota bacterium]
MDTKLTLTIEKDIIKQAKEYAQKKGRSLSDLIENYLKLMVSANDKIEDIEITPIVKSMMGKFVVPENFDENQALIDGLNKKYSK